MLEETSEPDGAAEKASSDAVELSEGEGAWVVVAVAVVDAERSCVGIATDDVASGPPAGWPPASRLARTASPARHGGGAQSSSATPDSSPVSRIVVDREDRWRKGRED
jgi:hypothetical protein